jgi:hypothetical protein
MVLSTRDALIALAEGKKLRPTHWPKKCYMYLNADGIIVDNDSDQEEFNSHTNYQLWEEPVTDKEQTYLFREEGSLAWYQADGTYSNDKQFQKYYPQAVEFIPLKGNRT